MYAMDMDVDNPRVKPVGLIQSSPFVNDDGMGNASASISPTPCSSNDDIFDMSEIVSQDESNGHMEGDLSADCASTADSDIMSVQEKDMMMQ